MPYSPMVPCPHCGGPFERSGSIALLFHLSFPPIALLGSLDGIFIPTYAESSMIARLRQDVHEIQRRLYQSKKNQDFWAKKAIKAKQTVTQLEGELAKEKSRVDALNKSYKALESEHVCAHEQLAQAQDELQQLRAEKEIPIEELTRNSQQSEETSFQGDDEDPDSLSSTVHELYQDLQRAKHENAILQQTMERLLPSLRSKADYTTYGELVRDTSFELQYDVACQTDQVNEGMHGEGAEEFGVAEEYASDTTSSSAAPCPTCHFGYDEQGEW